MATTIYPTVPVAQPAPDPWPLDDHPLGIQADEMFARQFDTGFAGEVRNLLHDPETGLAGKEPEEALIGIAEAAPKLEALKERYLAQAIGPRQRTILAPLIDSRLDRATGEIGRIAEQATSALDDRIVAERIADLQQDAALSWHDPVYLRRLGRSAVNELRYQGERRGWDETRTDTTVRQGLSDLYAGAVEQAIGQDPDRAAKLYDHAREVIQPDRQAAVERRIERAREEQRVGEIVSRLAETPDDPTRRPDLDDYQARALELTPPDASPETRAEVSRMARLEHAGADRAWQAARGRAAVAALDWLGKTPGTRLLAMPPELRDGLSPEQTEALDAAAINGGRPVTDPEVHKALDGLAVRDPAAFSALDLAQHRLSLDDGAYARLVGFQKAIVEGRSDPAFERHRLGRTLLDETLRQTNTYPESTDGDIARERLDLLLGAFEAIEGRPPTMADIRGLVGDAIRPPAGDPNIVRVNAPIDDSQVVQPQAPVKGSQGIAPNAEPVPGSPEYEAAARRVPVDSGIAPNIEPVPGSPEFRAAMAKTATKPHEGSIVILPNGKTVPSEDSPTGFLMAPMENLSHVAAAGRETFRDSLINGLKDPLKVKEAIGYARALVRRDLAQGGRFDYQRLWIPDNDAPDYFQLPQFRDVSNFNVGLYMQQALVPLDFLLSIAGEYAKENSSNYMPNEPYGLDPRTRKWIERGYEVGESGIFTDVPAGGPSRPR